MTTTRFAPSPTGHLHIGNLRTALFNFLVARKLGGTFILRLDDTDNERSRQEYVDSIMFDLDWLGLRWDRVERQSDRLDRYTEVAEQLKRDGRLYECFESPEELALKRRMQLRTGRAPIYDREGLRLSARQREELRSRRPGYWRFRLDLERVEWLDGIHGPVSVDAASVSDPVLIRADGQFLYTHASVVDDLDMAVSHVVRGADHLTNTATQVQIMRQLGGSLPFFVHHSLLIGVDGEPLAKRDGANSIQSMRAGGLEPIPILAILAAVGTSRQPQFGATAEALADGFELSAFSSAPTRIDETEFRSLNSKYLASLPFDHAAARVRKLGIPRELEQAFWSAVRENISNLDDLREWWLICRDGVGPVVVPKDREFVTFAMDLLPDPPFDHSTWKSWTGRVSEATGRRGKSLFMPLRLALTGRSTGPGMSELMPLLQNVRRG